MVFDRLSLSRTLATEIDYPAIPAHAADNDRQIKKLLNKLDKKAEAVEREALTAVRSAPFDPPKRGRIAVKIVTATGMEMTAVPQIEDADQFAQRRTDPS